MPFEVKVESAALLAQFDDLQKRLAELDQKLPDVFLEWQREDMKRTFPKIDAGSARSSTSAQSGLSVTAVIPSRSRRKRTATGTKGTGTKRTGTRRKRPRRIIGVKRPILRPVLVQKLFTRMKDMCREAIEWR